MVWLFRSSSQHFRWPLKLLTRALWTGFDFENEFEKLSLFPGQSLCGRSTRAWSRASHWLERLELRIGSKIRSVPFLSTSFSIFKSTTPREWIFISRWGNFHFIFQVVETVRDLKQAGIKVVKLCYKKSIIITIIIIKRVRWLLNWWTRRTINPFHLHQDPA